MLTKPTTTTSISSATLTPKDRNFYRPEQFIWNNPHRSSNRLYKYYHADNDYYQQNEAPKIEKLQQFDKENAQKERILRLIEHRNKSREILKKRQFKRQVLEERSYGGLASHQRWSKSASHIDQKMSQTISLGSFNMVNTQTLNSFKTLKKMVMCTQSELLLQNGQPQQIRTGTGLRPSCTLKKKGLVSMRGMKAFHD